MAITITNSNQSLKVEFSWMTLWIPKPFRVSLKHNRGIVWLLQGDSGVVNGRNDIKLPFSEVVSPVCSTIEDLADLLATYSTSVQSASGTFTDADLVAGVLTITHNLGSTNIAVVIRDPSGMESYQPNTIVDNNSLTVDFGGTIGAGTFTWFALTK